MENEEKRHIGRLFDRIAGKYDLLNHLLSLNIDKLWRLRLVKTMHEADHVLDVAIGTGDLAISMCEHKKTHHVIGIDLSNEMMRIGKEKAHGLPITFQEASALDMPFENGQFDAVTCSFGCRNFFNLSQGLKEMVRVLRTDGEMLILEFSYPSNPLIRRLYDWYFCHIMPRIGQWMSKDQSAYRYLNRSVKHFIWGESFCDQLRQAGLSQVRFRPLTFGIATLYYGKKTE